MSAKKPWDPTHSQASRKARLAAEKQHLSTAVYPCSWRSEAYAVVIPTTIHRDGLKVLSQKKPQVGCSSPGKDCDIFILVLQ